jgi:hypothetical protein
VTLAAAVPKKRSGFDTSRPNLADVNGDPEGVVSRWDELKGVDASLLILVKDIASTLEKHYPGWLWAVQPDKRGGIINIRSLMLSGRWGWCIKTGNIQNDPQRKLAVEAGGNILERFGFKRRGYNVDEWRAAKKYLGGVAMDITDKAAKVQKRYRDDQFSQAVRDGRIKLHFQDTKTAQGTIRKLIIQPSATWERDRRGSN